MKKSTKIVDAFEGGHRLERRDQNIYTAFTYGTKLKYQDLDDPNYKKNILMEMRSLRSPSREWIRKKILRIKDSDVLEDTAENAITDTIQNKLAQSMAAKKKHKSCHR